MAMTHAQILDEAAMLKKRADIHFAKGQYDDAVVTYTFGKIIHPVAMHYGHSGERLSYNYVVQ